MIYISKEKNACVFNEENFNINTNYIPDIVEALNELDAARPIHFAFDLKETPVVFVVYFRSLRGTAPTDVYLYYRDESEELKQALKAFKMEYRNITEYPWELPNEENIKPNINEK